MESAVDRCSWEMNTDVELHELAQGLLQKGACLSDGGRLSTAATSIATAASSPQNELDDEVFPPALNQLQDGDALQDVFCDQHGEGGSQSHADIIFGNAVPRKKKKNKGSRHGGKANLPRVASLSLERRCFTNVGRCDQRLPMAPDLSRSEADFFKTQESFPGDDKVSKDVLRARPRPATAIGRADARLKCEFVVQHDQGCRDRHQLREQNVERSRQSFRRLALDVAASHPASFLDFFQSDAKLNVSRHHQGRDGAATCTSNGAKKTVNCVPTLSDVGGGAQALGHLACSAMYANRPATGRARRKGPNVLDSSNEEIIRGRRDAEGKSVCANGASALRNGLGSEKSLESEKSQDMLVCVHLTPPSVRLQYKAAARCTPQRRCKSALSRERMRSKLRSASGDELDFSLRKVANGVHSECIGVATGATRLSRKNNDITPGPAYYTITSEHTSNSVLHPPTR
jgi:hypothetical protein